MLISVSMNRKLEREIEKIKQTINKSLGIAQFQFDFKACKTYRPLFMVSSIFIHVKMQQTLQFENIILI